MSKWGSILKVTSIVSVGAGLLGSLASTKVMKEVVKKEVSDQLKQD